MNVKDGKDDKSHLPTMQASQAGKQQEAIQKVRSTNVLPWLRYRFPRFIA